LGFSGRGNNNKHVQLEINYVAIAASVAPRRPDNCWDP